VTCPVIGKAFNLTAFANENCRLTPQIGVSDEARSRGRGALFGIAPWSFFKMNYPEEFSPGEICESAFYAYAGSFMMAAVAHISAGDTLAEKILVTIGGSIAWLFLAWVWTKQGAGRGNLANIVLLIAALLIGFDVAATVTS